MSKAPTCPQPCLLAVQLGGALHDLLALVALQAEMESFVQIKRSPAWQAAIAAQAAYAEFQLGGAAPEPTTNPTHPE